MADPRKTHRHYVFTINNPAEKTPLQIPDTARYCSWQKEKGDNGTIHYQGYLELNTPLRLGSIKKWGGDWAKAHLEVRRGTREEARDYSQKEDTRLEGPWELGTWQSGGAGSRTDLARVVEIIRETKSAKHVLEEAPEQFIRNFRGIERAIQLLDDRRRSWITELFIFWGDAGTGKSRWAAELGGESVYYLRKGNANAVWWDGYDGEETVILDDFYGWIPHDLLLRMADRYPLRVDFKGGSTQFLAKRIVVTSNSNWRNWYDYANKSGLNFAALERRVTVAVHMGNVGAVAPVLTWEKGLTGLPGFLVDEVDTDIDQRD